MKKMLRPAGLAISERPCPFCGCRTWVRWGDVTVLHGHRPQLTAYVDILYSAWSRPQPTVFVGIVYIRWPFGDGVDECATCGAVTGYANT